MAHAINEIGRFITKLPPDSTYYSSPVYLPLAFDLVDGRRHASLLTRGGKSLGYLASYEIIGYLLCEDRAQRTVDGDLVVNGMRITPEKYLGLWRSALEAAETPEDLFRRQGLALIATISAPLALVKAATRSWSGAPFQDFAAFEAKYGSAISYEGDRFSIRFDMRAPDAPRDAYYIADLVASACRSSDTAWHTAVSVEQAAQPPADDLFADARSTEAA